MSRKRRRNGRNSVPVEQEIKTRHHLRPRSRGGMDGLPNEASIEDKSLHLPYHTLFNNLRPNEVILLLIFSLETICPYMERKEPNTRLTRRGFTQRMKSWDTLFGENETWDIFRRVNKNQELAIRKIIENFVKTEQDRRLVYAVLVRGADRLRTNFFSEIKDLLYSLKK
ncbi:MAG: hypothetical protein WD712_02410 [Candidatus Spechtbacterales bacterium]